MATEEPASGQPESVTIRNMNAEVVKLGKKGQLSVPKGVMERLGLKGGEALLLDLTEDGAIVLRPAGVYPLEAYSDERVREFLEADRLSEKEREALSPVLSDEPGGKGNP